MLRILCTISLSLCSSSLFCAQILLDEVMPKDVQKQTGVYQLTPKQKVVLEAWINQTFVLKNEPTITPKESLYLSINLDNGRRIQLTDGTIWEIDPTDYPTSQIWIAPIPIKVVQSGNSNYPFLLVDKNSGISIKARKIETAPQSPAEVP